MTDDPFTEIDKAVFETALSIGKLEDREAFLAKVCAGDAGQRERIQDLLDASSDADNFFRVASQECIIVAEEAAENLQPSPASSKPESPREGPGSRIGSYTLLERIGEGGWGDVYLAEQHQPLRRQVALKLLRLGLDSEKVVARFELERQALAMMDHPGIARVFDAGTTESGRPYFVMELVHGVRITEHCNNQRLGLLQRLDLFIQVCHAIQHAHQKGVIHRDIKPSNILVSFSDGLAVPKVIDFGVARAVEGRMSGDTSITSGEPFVGTPAYMSPEQAAGEADTRSDIYSLGVLLFELLTGQPPFDTQRLAQCSIFELLRILREEEAPVPSNVLAALDSKKLATVAEQRGLEPREMATAVRGDLDWIVLKTLAKDRHLRYATVNGLATDLQRFLNDEPVLARPPGRLYLFGKLVRRNKAIFASATAVIVALLIGLVASNWFYVRERDARQAQERLRKEAEAARANEARLLQQSKARESVSQAAILLAEGKIEEADALLAKTPLTSIEPSIEAANVFRSLGDWNAIRQRWQQAADSYSLLCRVEFARRIPAGLPFFNLLIGIGPTFLEAGKYAEYQQLREEAIIRYGSMPNPSDAATLIKSVLLRPCDQSFLDRLAPNAKVVSANLARTVNSTDPVTIFENTFQLMSLGLLEYRRGNHTQALEWNRQCNASPSKIPPRSATAHAVSAMAAFQLGQTTLARSELAQAREFFAAPFAKDTFPRGTGQGIWQDWAIARVLLREAEALVDANPERPR